MKVYLNKITGISDAMISMLMSKKSWTREKAEDIKNAVYYNVDLEDIAGCNIKKLEQRYPTGYFRVEDSVNRSE